MSRPRVRPAATDPGIVDRISEGLISGRSIKKVCDPEDMPSLSAVYIEMARNKEFYNAIASARESQQDAISDEIVDMADEANIENWQLVKLRIWARQWRASKLAPKKYGEKVTQEIIGDANNPVTFKGTSAVEFVASRIAGIAAALRPSEDTGGTDGSSS